MKRKRKTGTEEVIKRKLTAIYNIVHNNFNLYNNVYCMS